MNLVVLKHVLLNAMLHNTSPVITTVDKRGFQSENVLVLFVIEIIFTFLFVREFVASRRIKLGFRLNLPSVSKL